MKGFVKSTIAILATTFSFILSKYKLTAVAFLVLIFFMIVEQISYIRVTTSIKKENKKLKGKKKVFKNQLHSDKFDNIMMIAVIIVVEVALCICTGTQQKLIGATATVLYYCLINLASFCVNQKVYNNDKVLWLLDSIVNKLIFVFSIGIDIVEDKADDVLTNENIEKIVTKIINNKIETVENKDTN